MVKKSVRIAGKKISFDIDETLDKALQEFVLKTGMRQSAAIKEALEDYIINKAHETIPKLSARVEARQTLKEYKEAGQLMKLILSSGHGSFNLQDVFDDIERMPIVEKQKEQLREAAKFYNGFKRDGGSKVSRLMPIAYPHVEFEKKTREDKLLSAMRKLSICKGCQYLGKDDFCKSSCKEFKKLSQ